MSVSQVHAISASENYSLLDTSFSWLLVTIKYIAVLKWCTRADYTAHICVVDTCSTKPLKGKELFSVFV